MPEPDPHERALAAQAEAHGADHDYVRGSPHLRHDHLRSLVVDHLTAFVTRLREERGSAEVLEVGGGHGTFTDALLAAGATVTVNEVSEASADLLRERFAGDDRVRVVHDPTGVGVLEDGTWDGVVVVAVLHHVPDYLSFVAELVEHVRPGGGFLSAQDPLWYGRVPRATRWAVRASYYVWRLGAGDYRRGWATLRRRLRGVYDEAEPSDLVEYHVVRDGVDDAALVALLGQSFADVDRWAYWSTNLPVLQRWGTRRGMTTDFGITALGRSRHVERPSTM